MTLKSGLILCASAAVMLIMPASAAFADSASAKTTMTAAQCEALFDKADIDHDGSLAQHEDPMWQEHLTRIERLPKDTMIIHKDDFMAACEKGAFDNM